MKIINELFLLMYLIFKRINFSCLKKFLIKIFMKTMEFYGRGFFFVVFIAGMLSAAGIISGWLFVILSFCSVFVFLAFLLNKD